MNLMVKWYAAKVIILVRWALGNSSKTVCTRNSCQTLLHLRVMRDQLVNSHTIPESHPTWTLASFVATFLPINYQVSGALARVWNFLPSKVTYSMSETLLDYQYYYQQPNSKPDYNGRQHFLCIHDMLGTALYMYN